METRNSVQPEAESVATLTPAEMTVVVTARKREELITDVPIAITSFSEQSLRDYDVHSFADYATKTPNLSFAYGNGATAGDAATGIGNARTLAIRGVAGARTTGFYIDDTPLPGAVDVRVVDLHGIEVLKGPQGTLFGESSLGGNVRLISKPPSLVKNDFRYMVGAGHTKDGGVSLDSEAEAVGNIVLSPGTAALRLVTFWDDSAGYLTRNYPADINNASSQRISVDNQGAQRSFGGSVTGLLRINQNVDLSFRVMHQELHDNGFPAAYAPLPAFSPIDHLDRSANIQPVVDDRWTMPTFTLTWRGDGWTLTSATSHFSRDTHDLEDSTEGTAQYWESTIAQGFAWSGHHSNRQISHETRLVFDPVANLSGTVGVFYARNEAQFSIDPIYGLLSSSSGPNSLLWDQLDNNTQKDKALFGELYYKFADKFALTLGDRRYWLAQSDDLTFDILHTHFKSKNNNSAHGDSPKIALSYQASPQSLVYTSASKGFRAGGAQLNVSGFGCDSSLAAIGQTAQSIAKIQPDTVKSYELGGKLDFPSPGLLLTGSLFSIDWDRIQQPLFLDSCQFYVQANAGAARINGAEVELDGHVTPALKIRLGAGYQDARITEAGGTGQLVGSRIYQTPKWTLTLGGVYTKPISDMMKGFVSADYSYTGDSISANSGPGSNLVRQSFGLINARLGVAWVRSELTLNIHNLSNQRPNLGDIGYLGYARQVNPPSDKTVIPQVATLPPRTMMVQYRQSF